MERDIQKGESDPLTPSTQGHLEHSIEQLDKQRTSTEASPLEPVIESETIVQRGVEVVMKRRRFVRRGSTDSEDPIINALHNTAWL